MAPNHETATALVARMDGGLAPSTLCLEYEVMVKLLNALDTGIK